MNILIDFFPPVNELNDSVIHQRNLHPAKYYQWVEEAQAAQIPFFCELCKVLTPR